jgi:CubicO group peptidase (beta-lactamase class C family)
LATGYGSKKGLPTPVKYHEIAVRPAGSIFSSVNDMAKYLAALMNGGRNEHGEAIKPETLQTMMEPHYQIDERLPAMGLAFWLDKIDGHRIVGHGGGWPGFVSAMQVAPDDGLGVIVFTNTNSMAPDAIARGLLRRMLDVPEASAHLPRPGIPEAPHLWHELCGFYGPRPGFMTNARVWMIFGGEAEVFVKDNHLAVRSLVGPIRKGLRLYPIDAADPLLFQTEYQKLAIPILFKRNDAGQIDRLCVGGGLGFTTAHKRPRSESLRLRGAAAVAGLAVLVGALGWRKLWRR